eukprot:1159961-Rhodomonas_salina.1
MPTIISLPHTKYIYRKRELAPHQHDEGRRKGRNLSQRTSNSLSAPLPKPSARSANGERAFRTDVAQNVLDAMQENVPKCNNSSQGISVTHCTSRETSTHVSHTGEAG